MTQTDQIGQDLRYVRHAVARRGMLERTPAAIAWLWAFFILVSFALLDFKLRAAMWMFAVGAPICGVVSGIIGATQAKKEGTIDHRSGRLHALHWGSIFLGMIALSVLAAAGRVSGPGVGQVSTIIVGLVYFLGGVHFDWRWMISGLLLLVGGVAITWVPFYPWTVLGSVICLALIVPTFIGRPQSHEQQ